MRGSLNCSQEFRGTKWEIKLEQICLIFNGKVLHLESLFFSDNWQSFCKFKITPTSIYCANKAWRDVGITTKLFDETFSCKHVIIARGFKVMETSLVQTCVRELKINWLMKVLENVNFSLSVCWCSSICSSSWRSINLHETFTQTILLNGFLPSLDQSFCFTVTNRAI